MVLLAKLNPLLLSSIVICLSLLGLFSCLIISLIRFINCIDVIFLDLETEETIKDFKGIMPLGVSIYLFFKILEIVEG